MTTKQIEKRRKYFFVGISLLATAITLASFGATYAINKQSFSDWGGFGRAFTLLASIGIEVTFALTLFGVAYALVGLIEKGIGAALLLGTIFIMATNYIVHHKMITGVPLTGWHVDYIEWAGPLSIFGILLLIVGIVVFNHDAQERRLDREYEFAARRKVLEWREEQLNSTEFGAHMEKYRPRIFEDAGRALGLPALPAARQKPGFISEDERGEADTSPKI